MRPANVNIFIFRRDLRLLDNKALAALSALPHPILPIFIFNPLQIDPHKNPYYSVNSVQFMVECLKDLRTATQNSLVCFHGYDLQVLDALKRTYVIDTIAFNEDYTAFAKSRDDQIRRWCTQNNINIITAQDYTLFPIKSITTTSQTPYEIFTPFYRKCISQATTITKPSHSQTPRFFKPSTRIANSITDLDQFYGGTSNPALLMKGGRFHAIEALDKVRAKVYFDYDKQRDIPAVDKTTRLSPYIKFGCVSIREVFEAFKRTYGLTHGLVRELLWREFYAHLISHHAHMINPIANTPNQPFKSPANYRQVPWTTGKLADTWFQRWCQGKTGFPLVDAGMRQLVKVGWMHNRCRMVVAIFLTKDLMIDWRQGECFFAQHLIDYDPCSNSGGWQWCSPNTGVDSAPYLRIFSPWAQAKRFDPDAKFIKAWIPELRNVPPKAIINWETAHTDYKEQTSYPAPMVDHKAQVEKLTSFFK